MKDDHLPGGNIFFWPMTNIMNTDAMAINYLSGNFSYEPATGDLSLAKVTSFFNAILLEQTLVYLPHFCQWCNVVSGPSTGQKLHGQKLVKALWYNSQKKVTCCCHREAKKHMFVCREL